MEDDGFVDDEFIEETARDLVARHGWNAVMILHEQVEIAEVSGDYLLAQTWRGIVEAAERLLGLDCK